jgi:imidazolonepropionase-like amidohydrolase
MVERGTGYVPTLHAVKHTLAAVSQARSSPARDLLVEVMSRHSAAVRAAYEAGVRILVGTDGGGVIEHGEVVTEILELVDAGLSPEAAVSAGSWDARSFFGLPGIDEGAPADLGVYPSDPRTDPRVLRSPDLLILAGKALAVPSH